MSTTKTALTDFAHHVQAGLAATPKQLSSKYFYDDEGSRLFQQIMAMPEYYLTNAEDEILRTQSAHILAALQFDQPFNIIELGAGDGAKTLHLLRHLQQQQVDCTFIPIDISSQAISDLMERINGQLPNLKVEPMVGDYHHVMRDITSSSKPNLVLFLGSNIGNFEWVPARRMLTALGEQLREGDKLLIGFDLKKNPHLVHAAYSDATGITKAFNLNLLRRINRELGANFDLARFDFFNYYNPLTGEVRSFIVSLAEQQVHIEAIGQTFDFKNDEVIRTELSKKYSLGEIEELARKCGFEVIASFQDSKNYFADSLWVRR